METQASMKRRKKRVGGETADMKNQELLEGKLRKEKWNKRKEAKQKIMRRFRFTSSGLRKKKNPGVGSRGK